MKHMKKYIWFVMMLFIMIGALSCQGERYRKDRSNRLTSKAERASDHHAKQAFKLTQRNLDRKDARQKASEKRKTKHQQHLNELNARSKVKSGKASSGKFTIY
jgi:hypothetical protein